MIEIKKYEKIRREWVLKSTETKPDLMHNGSDRMENIQSFAGYMKDLGGREFNSKLEGWVSISPDKKNKTTFKKVGIK